MSGSEPAWHLHNRTARLSGSNILHALFDTHLPYVGLRDVTWRDAIRIDRLFGLSNLNDKASPPAETYVRQPDLVVHYATDPADHVARSVYWRAASTTGQRLEKDKLDPKSLQIELLLSLSTLTLDSHPSNTLRTEFVDFQGEIFVADTLGAWQAISLEALPIEYRQPAPESSEQSRGASDPPAEGIVLIRPAEQECSIALGVYPSDLAAWHLEFDASQRRLTVNFHLREEFLEKGVIRRFRAACSFWPRSADRALAHRWFQRFAQSSPPLTT